MIPDQGYVFPGPIRARIAIPGIPFFGSIESGVRAHGKNAVLPLFFKTSQKEGFSNLQYSGLSFALVSRMGHWRGPGQKRPLLRRFLRKKRLLYPRFFWSIRAWTEESTWQKDPRFPGLWWPFSDIEIGRISENGTHLRLIFHTNPNGRFYGLFREGPELKIRNPGPILARIRDGRPWPYNPDDQSELAGKLIIFVRINIIWTRLDPGKGRDLGRFRARARVRGDGQWRPKWPSRLHSSARGSWPT